MDIQFAVDIFQIIGSIATTFSLLAVVAIYFNDYLRRQAEDLWEFLFDCERDFVEVFKEFDQKALAQNVGSVLSHPRLYEVITRVWENKDKTLDEITSIVDAQEMDIKYAILDSLAKSTSSELEKLGEKYQIALFKIRPKYPVLHNFLEMVYAIMAYCTSLSRKSDTYYELIRETLVLMKKQGDLEKQKTQSNVHSFVYGVALMNLTQLIEKQKLNDLLRSVGNLLRLILNLYRTETHFRLWLLSQKERGIPQSQYIKDGVTERFKAVVEIKKKVLGEEYGNASILVGNAEAILKAKHK
jgi:hypothetical protein